MHCMCFVCVCIRIVFFLGGGTCLGACARVWALVRAYTHTQARLLSAAGGQLTLEGYYFHLPFKLHTFIDLEGFLGLDLVLSLVQSASVIRVPSDQAPSLVRFPLRN
jgi:hypothetical protein